MVNTDSMTDTRGKTDYEAIAMVVVQSSMVFLWTVVSTAYPYLGG